MVVVVVVVVVGLDIAWVNKKLSQSNCSHLGLWRLEIDPRDGLEAGEGWRLEVLYANK